MKDKADEYLEAYVNNRMKKQGRQLNVGTARIHLEGAFAVSA